MDKKISAIAALVLVIIVALLICGPVWAQKKSAAAETVFKGTIKDVTLTGVILGGKPVMKKAKIYLNEHPGKEFITPLDILYKMGLAKKSKGRVEVKLILGQKVFLTCQKGGTDKELKVVDLIVE